MKGSSKISGEFIVEEIITDDDKLLRRIIFLNNPHVTQSEALVKFGNMFIFFYFLWMAYFLRIIRYTF